MPENTKTFMIENAEIIFRNFEGKEGPFNSKGDRNFSVIIPTKELEQQLLADNWNVKYLKPRDEGDDPVPYVSVRVNFDNRPPRIVMITSAGRTNIVEDLVETLDWADIKQADLICNGYDWEVQGKTGTKAYLKTLFITIEEDELESKYAAMSEDDRA
jgi:hypothetical protein